MFIFVICIYCKHDFSLVVMLFIYLLHYLFVYLWQINIDRLMSRNWPKAEEKSIGETAYCYLYVCGYTCVQIVAGPLSLALRVCCLLALSEQLRRICSGIYTFLMTLVNWQWFFRQVKCCFNSVVVLAKMSNEISSLDKVETNWTSSICFENMFDIVACCCDSVAGVDGALLSYPLLGRLFRVA